MSKMIVHLTTETICSFSTYAFRFSCPFFDSLFLVLSSSCKQKQVCHSPAVFILNSRSPLLPMQPYVARKLETATGISMRADTSLCSTDSLVRDF